MQIIFTRSKIPGLCILLLFFTITTYPFLFIPFVQLFTTEIDRLAKLESGNVVP